MYVIFNIVFIVFTADDLQHPAIEYSTTSQDANRLSDPTYAESDSVSDVRKFLL